MSIAYGKPKKWRVICAHIHHLLQPLLFAESFCCVCVVSRLFESKNVQLIDELKRTRTREAEVRARVDSLSHATLKAKNTVATAKMLWGALTGSSSNNNNTNSSPASPPPASADASGKRSAPTSPAPSSAAASTSSPPSTTHSLQQQQHNAALGQVRQERAEALQTLEQLVTLRSVAQNEILNVSSIVSELRADCERRNYHALLKAVCSKFFARAFGKSVQAALAPVIKVRCHSPLVLRFSKSYSCGCVIQCCLRVAMGTAKRVACASANCSLSRRHAAVYAHASLNSCVCIGSSSAWIFPAACSSLQLRFCSSFL